jgi:glycosyltransferase involved in cell wall biosynthesis
MTATGPDRAPTVSVVVTAFNHERFIGTALESVLAQSYRDYEIVVVDDGSSDSTRQRVCAFGNRVRLFTQGNQGVAGSRNAGIRQARGGLVAFLDGDDIWEADKLACQVEAVGRHPSSGLFAVDGVQFGEAGVLRPTLFGPPVAGLLCGRDSVTLRCCAQFLEQNLISTMSQVMIPRTVLDTVGPSDSAFPLASDLDLYIRIASRYDVTFIGRTLTRWRYLASSASGPEEVRDLRWAADGIEILKKHLRDGMFKDSRLLRSILVHRINAAANAAYYYGVSGNVAFARRYLLRLLAANPTSHALPVLLLGLYTPRPIARFLGRPLRRMFRLPHPTE